MSSEPGSLVATLRASLEMPAEDASQALYEDWLTRDTWRLDSEAVALLVGCAPDEWPRYCARHGLDESSRTLNRALADAFGCAPDAAVEPLRLRGWAQANGVELPPAFARLADYIARVLPAAAGAGEEGAQAAAAAAGERELLLGAALALVTRFPEQCRDAHGFFDGARIADLILEKAALWFPHEPPRMERAAIAALLERYLS